MALVSASGCADSSLAELSEMSKFKRVMAEVHADAPFRNAAQKEAHRWNPYSFEGGSVAAVAGDGFVVVGGDTRMSQLDNINIFSRETDKLHVLNDSIVLATGGFYGDALQLRRLLEARLAKFRFDYRKDMTVDLCAEMLSRTLYYKRFFPFYTNCVLAGIDEKGKGAVYSYDPIGCIERLPYSCSGHGEPMMTPFLDCQVGQVTLSDDVEKPVLTLDRAIGIVKDAIRVTAERETSTGDKIQLLILQHGKPLEKKYIKLRED